MLCAQKRKRVAVSAATATALAVIAMHWTLQKVQEELDDLDAQLDALPQASAWCCRTPPRMPSSSASQSGPCPLARFCIWRSAPGDLIWKNGATSGVNNWFGPRWQPILAPREVRPATVRQLSRRPLSSPTCISSIALTCAACCWFVLGVYRQKSSSASRLVERYRAKSTGWSVAATIVRQSTV